MTQSLYTRDNLKPSSWRVILVQLTEKTTEYPPKITWVLFLSPLTVFFQHKLTYASLDSKLWTQRSNKWIIIPKSLLMLSVTNDQFNYYRILWDYTNTKSSKWLITLSHHWFWNTYACINLWRVILSFKSFLRDRAVKNQTAVTPKAFPLDGQSHRQINIKGWATEDIKCWPLV